MNRDHLVHLLNYYLAYPNEAIDVELVDTLIYMDRWSYSCPQMMLAIRCYTYEYKPHGHAPRWESVACHLLDAGCHRAVAALTHAVHDGAIKECLITLMLKRKGITLPSSIPPSTLSAPR